MNTQQLKNFVAVAEQRSMTKAAELLLIAQPALSLQIRTLEDSLGTPLFIRKPRSVELTEAGKIYYSMAKSALRLEENTEIEIANTVSGKRGVLKLGMTPSYPDLFLSRLLHRYSEEYPGVSYEIYEHNSPELMTELERGIIDVALICSSYPLPAAFQKVSETAERFYVFWNPKLTALDPSAPLTAESLAGVPLCVPRGLSERIFECFRLKNAELNLRAVCTTRGMTLETARLTRSAAILSETPYIHPSINYNNDYPQLISQALYVPETSVRRTAIICRGRKLPAAAELFVELLKKYFAALDCTEQA